MSEYSNTPPTCRPAPIWRSTALALPLLAQIAGCAVHSDALTRPDDAVTSGYTHPLDAETSEEPTPVDRWWEAFGTPALTRTVDHALATNPNLAAAWARVVQAELAITTARSGLFPTIDLETSVSRNRTFFPPPINSRTANRYNLGVQAGYEVDLWGRLRAQRDAAVFDLEATALDRDAMALSMAAEVVEAWLDLQGVVENERLLEAQIETNQRYLELVLLRLGTGQGSALDVYQMRQTIEAQVAQRPLLAAQRDVAHLRVAALAGRFDRPEELTLDEVGLPPLPPLPELGVPSDLLERRPDVRAAWLRAESADRRIAMAIADRLPTIRLSGNIGHTSEEFSILFDDFIWGLTAGLTAPLFDAGRRRAEVERNRAIVEERIATWRNTFVGALREVEEALVREREQRAHIDLLVAQRVTANAAVDAAREQYRNGLVDYLRVLNALSTAQRLEQDILTAHRQLLTFRVNLHRALGGGWLPDDPTAQARAASE